MGDPIFKPWSGVTHDRVSGGRPGGRLAMVWLLPLVTGEVLRPRLTYDVRRWATVFPLGMYAACSFAAGQVTGISGIADFGHVWTWVAFTVSLFVLAGLFRHGWPVLRDQHRPAAAEDGASRSSRAFSTRSRVSSASAQRNARQRCRRVFR